MAWKRIIVLAMLCVGGCGATDRKAAPAQVGAESGGGIVVATEQIIRAAGKAVAYHGRPVDLAASPDGKTVYAKSNASLVVIDAESWSIRQEIKYPEKAGGASIHGMLVSADGREVLVSLQTNLVRANVSADGQVKWGKTIALAGMADKRTGASYPCGMAWLDANRVAVCLSMNNSLAIVNLATGTIEKQIEVGVAPYDVAVSRDGTKAFVSNWGGRRPAIGDKTADSAGTETVVDERGTASTGNVGIIDLTAGRQITEIETGLHPADLEMSSDFKTLFVANANSDTVSVIDTTTDTLRETINVRPDEKLPFGSASNAVALSKDQKTLFVANGGNNAVAVVDVAKSPATVRGFIPAGWYPDALAMCGGKLAIANLKGIGSREPAGAGKWNSHNAWGTIGLAELPDDAQLAQQTKQVMGDALVPQALRAFEKAQSGKKPVVVPEHPGEPSLIQHVVYIIQENRTYDQIYGDMPHGNNDPKLCTFGREVTPNRHALAEQFALLDNYYCNGVLSADGHAWSMEGVAVDYIEKSFGGWSRSYPFPGDDALALAPSGFIWDNVLLHGGTFRNYGEMSVAHPEPAASWKQISDDWKNKSGRIKLTQKMANATLRKYSCAESPGWNLHVSDQIRADVFLKEFAAAEREGKFSDLTIIYLPQDHCSGTNPGQPTPSAMVADNDLAVGRIVDAISHSQFWRKTCIFAIEDDPQSGFDHVDGHRSTCLAISPYTKRGAVVSAFYNQTSVLHTMELMLGCPPMNQFDAMAPAMGAVFTSKADATPYTCVANKIPLDQMNPEKAALSGAALKMAEASEKLPLELPDQADENTLNRIVWFATKGADSKYPAEFAGAHGRGLRALHLKLDASGRDKDDD